MMIHNRQTNPGRSLVPKTAWIGLLLAILLLPACQRTVAPELPYDSETSRQIRTDLDQFLEPE